MHSEVRSETRKQQVWIEDKVDEEIERNKTAEEYDVTKQNTGYTPIIYTGVNILKNKIPN
jgi:GH25 family lysozyme M1 (1,4-beta-N-acetylmuramidase)